MDANTVLARVELIVLREIDPGKPARLFSSQLDETNNFLCG